MSRVETLRDHYASTYPADAARALEGVQDYTGELEGLSPTALSKLLEHVEPGRLREIFLPLNTDRRGEALASTSIRSVNLAFTQI